jgi:hypothetical protein
MAYRFEADEGVREAIARCAREQLDHAVGELSEGIGDDPVGSRVYAEKPKAFERRMRRSWKAGRAASHVPLEQNPAELAHATRAVHAD